MNNEIEFDHFKDINDLLKNIDSWYREDDIEYTRWFGLTDLYNLKIYITFLQQKVKQLEQKDKEIDRLNNIIDEFEDWLGKQRIRNSEWDNFVIKDTRLGIPITYLLDKLKELKENNNV